MSFSTEEWLEILNENGSSLMAKPGCSGKEWLLFRHPLKILKASSIEEIKNLFLQLEIELAQGKCAAGFVAYEAGAAFDNAILKNRQMNFPLAQILIYDLKNVISVKLPQIEESLKSSQIFLKEELLYQDYLEQFNFIKKNIIAGNIYQANLTFKLIAEKVEINPAKLFCMFISQHPVPYAAFMNLSKYQIVSLSPELFLESDGQFIYSSPMKGTIQRQLSVKEDSETRKALSKDLKNRAENLMITDMVRNDLGRICKNSSIYVAPLFHVDTYRTVHQMVSTVHGELKENVDLFKIFQATFPPASITGAPKIRAVNLITQTEKSPRNLYTGTIGCFFPNRVFSLNVAIRTFTFENQRMEGGVGGGIVYDSTVESEWKEALLKSHFVTFHDPIFNLFETMKWTLHEGFIYQEAHLKRLQESQKYFGRSYPHEKIKSELLKIDKSLKIAAKNGVKEACVKLSLFKDERIEIIVSEMRSPDWSVTLLNLFISNEKVNSKNLFLYHKTTIREQYSKTYLQGLEQGFHEVLFMNENDELTEGCISNLFIRKNNQWFTPPIKCGLLPGIWRQKMLKKLSAKEKILTIEDLKKSDKVLIGNSLRGCGEVKTIKFLDEIWKW